jgi:hypothetical protein
MKFRTLWCIVLTILITISFAHPDLAAADPDGHIDWKKGEFGYLAKFAGAYRFLPVLDDPHVAKELSRLVGSDLPHLRQNLLVSGPVDMIDGQIVLTGGRPNQTHEERGYVSVNMYDGEVRAAIYSQGQTTIYTEGTNYEYMENDIKLWIHWDQIDDLIQKAPTTNLKWLKPGRKK